MAIILEGPDAAGKTTLGRQLADLGMRLVVSGGAPKTPEEVASYCQMQFANCHDRKVVLDRVTPISHPIYNPAYIDNELIDQYLERMLSMPELLIVYCRPPTEALMRPEKHQWKDYDTEEHKQKILRNQMNYIDQYDRLFASIPHLSYDYTEREQDYSVELVAMLAATQHDDRATDELRRLLMRRSYVSPQL